MEKKKITEEEFNEMKKVGEAHLETLKEWGKAKREDEQIIYAQGLSGNMVTCAISGNKISTLSLMYDLLEEVARESEIDFIPMIMGFLQIYHTKSGDKSEKKSDKNDKDPLDA